MSKTFQNNPNLKVALINELRQNPTSWKGGTGYKNYDLFLGIPRILGALDQKLHEKLQSQLNWRERFWQAIPVGVDLSGVWSQFVIWLLADPTTGVVKHLETLEDEFYKKGGGTTAQNGLGQVLALEEQKATIEAVAALYGTVYIEPGTWVNDRTANALELFISWGDSHTPWINARNQLADALTNIGSDGIPGFLRGSTGAISENALNAALHAAEIFANDEANDLELAAYIILNVADAYAHAAVRAEFGGNTIDTKEFTITNDDSKSKTDSDINPKMDTEDAEHIIFHAARQAALALQAEKLIELVQQAPVTRNESNSTW